MDTASPAKLRKRKCKVCRNWYYPQKATQRVCGDVSCALSHARSEQRKARDGAHRARKKALRDNDRQFHLREAQKAFNRFIRTRDMHLPCVSCGRFHNGKWNAGHYRAIGRGGASPLRFNEINVHKQCEPCNSHLSGNVVEFRLELIRRIGLPLVEWLEKDHPPCKWTIPELKAIRKYYENAVKEMTITPGEAEPF